MIIDVACQCPPCSSQRTLPAVIFQPFFTVDTSRYFKRNYTESPTKSSSKSSSPLSSPTPTDQKVPPSRPPPPSHPPPKSKRSEKTLLKILKTLEAEPEGQGSSGGVAEVTGSENGSESKVAASPATGQVHIVEQTDSQERAGGRCFVYLCISLYIPVYYVKIKAVFWPLGTKVLWLIV